MQSGMCGVLDSNLTALLTTYLDFDDCLQLSRLNKMFNQFVFKANEVSDYIWRH